MDTKVGRSRLGGYLVGWSLMVVLLSGCGVATPPAVAVTLPLVRADGAELPADVYQELVVPVEGDPWLLELVVVQGLLVLEPSGGYRHELTLEAFQDGVLVGRQRWADQGIWSPAADGLVFTSSLVDGHAFTGFGGGNEWTLVFDLIVFVGTRTQVELTHQA